MLASKLIDQAAALKATNDIELSKHILQRIIEDLPKSKEAIIRSHKHNDRSTLDDHVHKLCGGTSFCGLISIKQITINLRKSIAHRDTEAIDRYVAELAEEIDRVIEAYRNKMLDITDE